MPINVTIGSKEQPRTITLELNARKSMSGDIMVFDHADIDIVLVLEEGKVLTFPKDIMSEVDMTLVNVSKWIDEERPYFEYVDSYEDQDAERILDPDDMDSTELGEVPHEEEKGSIRPGWMRDPYSLNYLYTSG